MQLALIALIGIGSAVVTGLFAPLAIRSGRAFQKLLKVLPEDQALQGTSD